MTEALRASEEQYRTLAEAAHDMIFTITRDGRIGYVNSFGANFLGLEPQQLIGQPRERLFRSEINPQQEDHIQNVFKTGQAISSENAIKFSNRTIWFNTWLVPLRGSAGEISSILGVSRDITERRKSLEALQQAREQLEERVAERTKELLASQEKLRLLATQTVNAQEKERRSISRELHDEAGQALITLKYDLASIQNELPETDALLRQRLSESMKIIDQTMLHIRDLAHSLRPPVLEVGGIHLSLQDYCQEISGRTHIPISYQGLDIPGIPDETGISLYRFVQEALTNIMKHAHATKVKVRLHYNKGEISLSVSDNGRGMGEPDRSEGLGLLGIKERLNLLGGKLEIHSQKGRGTKLVAHVPWVSSGIE
jgi:PAS domain S-box-containing protein